MHCMFTNHLNPNYAEYHIYIQIAKLCMMSAKANFAFHVDVTDPGDPGSQFATSRLRFLLSLLRSLIHASSGSFHLLSTPNLGSTEANSGW